MSTDQLRQLAGRLWLILERPVLAAAWLALVALIALGAATAVAGLDNQPGTPARPELTWLGDSAAAPVLEAATEELEAISARLDALGVRGRGALAALEAREPAILNKAISEGSALVSDLRRRSSALRGQLGGLEAFGPGAGLRLSQATREHHAALVAALDTTDGLAQQWARLAVGGHAASRLSGLLEQHDLRVAAAIEVGSVGSFPTALRRLAAASGLLADADRLRAQLQNTVDVDTLVEWIRRNRAYDEALGALYEASAASPNRQTPAIRDALRAEAAAREDLPRDTRGLSIIMADIAQGGLNQAVIEIEVARGELAGALAALRETGSDATP